MNTFLPLLPLDPANITRPTILTQKTKLPVLETLSSQACAYGGLAGLHQTCVNAYARSRLRLPSLTAPCLICRRHMKDLWNAELAQKVLEALRLKPNDPLPIYDMYFGLGVAPSDKLVESAATSPGKWLSNCEDPVPEFDALGKSAKATSNESPAQQAPLLDRVHVVDSLDAISDILDLGTSLDHDVLKTVVLAEYGKYSPISNLDVLEAGQGVFSKVEYNTIWLYHTIFGISEWHLIVLHGAEEHGFYIPKIDAIGIWYSLEQVRTQLVRLSYAGALDHDIEPANKLSLTTPLIKRLIGAAALTRRCGEDNIQDAYRLSREGDESTRWQLLNVRNLGIFIVECESTVVSALHTVSPDTAYATDLSEFVSQDLQQGFWEELKGQLLLER